MNKHIFLSLIFLVASFSLFVREKILNPQSYKHYIDSFNAHECQWKE